jgi:hypothetical protein
MCQGWVAGAKSDIFREIDADLCLYSPVGNIDDTWGLEE